AEVGRTLFGVIAGDGEVGVSHPVATPVLVPRGSTATAP
ncbi:LacI family transcriptional regulator, partial [Streptomyces caniscabiei]|nr:LacI family transcriptional regulator [Streptomyces caniscabiei]